jgi:hypothetical protein
MPRIDEQRVGSLRASNQWEETMMINLRRHSAHDYSMLPDMDATDVGVLTDRDRHCLDELGEYLVRSNNYTRFGIGLLHSHFPVGDDEVLIERADRANRSVSLSPYRAICDDELVPLSIRFDASAARDCIEIIGLEYAKREELADVSLSNDETTTLDGIRRILQRHDAIDRFGVRLIHDQLDLGDGEVLLESCDLHRRQLSCAVTTIDDPQFVKSIETFWCWEPVDASGDSTAVQACERKCVRGCVSLPHGHQTGGHDGSHDRS